MFESCAVLVCGGGIGVVVVVVCTVVGGCCSASSLRHAAHMTGPLSQLKQHLDVLAH